MEREPDSEVTDVPESMIEYKLFICTYFSYPSSTCKEFKKWSYKQEGSTLG